MSAHRRIGIYDHLIGLALCVSYVALLLVTSRGLGMTRDEGFYVDAADRYAVWLELLWRDPHQAVQREQVDAAWSANHEHPSLCKGMFALFHIAQEKWHLFSQPSMSYRFFGMLCGGLLLWLVYVFGARAYGRRVGVFAAIACALIPHIFFHSHLDCFDLPIALMMTWVTYCYWRSLTDARWAIVTGIAYGLALETKHNAWTLPVVLYVHWLFVAATELRARKAPIWQTILLLAIPFGGAILIELWARLTKAPGRRLSLVPWWFMAMLLLGPPIFVYGWPWLWFDTTVRFGEYAGFHLNHVYYNMAYFGVNYFQPPFPSSYAWVMTLFTVPLTTTVLAIAGMGIRLRTFLPAGLMERLWPNGKAMPDPARTDVLALGSLLAPLVVISMPWTPIFGGTKHWLSAYPFLAIFAGVGFARVAAVLGEVLGDRARGARWLTSVGAALVLLLPGAIETEHSHPFGLSHYGFAAGGVPGAADYGMNRQFWGFTTGSLVGYFNSIKVTRKGAAPGFSVWICDTTWTSWQMLQRDGRLMTSIRASADMAGADYAIVHHEHHFAEVDYQIWQAFGSVQPAHVLTYDGVPIITVYENPRHRRAVGSR